MLERCIFLTRQLWKLSEVMQKIIEKISNKSHIWLALAGIVFLSPFIYGLYHEWLACIAAVALCAILLLRLRHNGQLRIQVGVSFAAVFVLVAAYGFSAFWATDSGMALMGFVKFLPVMLFSVVLMQLDTDELGGLLRVVPASGFVMTVLSFGFSRIPLVREAFVVDSRLAGFFQYPNTYAIFLLLGIIVLAQVECRLFLQLIGIAVLLLGILMSGSRTVFILLCATVPILFFATKKKSTRVVLAALAAAGVFGVALYAYLTQNTSGMARFMTTSLETSTLIVRFLYFKDALPIILRCPLGMGYMGYYFEQGSFKTGLYSVAHIHNELLQLLLDIGWIPALLVSFAILRTLFSKNTSRLQKLLLAMLCAHCMLDFDLHFLSMFFILLLTLNWSGGKTFVIKSKSITVTAAAIFSCISIYIGTANLMYISGHPEMAAMLYPPYTSAQIYLLTQTTTAQQMNRRADIILQTNQHVALAYSAKARSAYAAGNFENMIKYKERAIELTRYALEEYIDYINMLQVGIELYTEAGDSVSAEFCRARLLEVPNMIEAVLADTDPIAWRVADKPQLTLPQKYAELINSMQ